MEKFPSTKLAGCLFHFAQICFRKLKSEGLVSAYNKKEESILRHDFHRLIALAFVPEADVADSFYDLCNDVDGRLQPLLDHLNAHYVHGYFRGQKKPKFVPLEFPIPLWNCYTRVLASMPRTTNFCEGWNHKFNVLIRCQHNNFYAFLKSLCLEEGDVHQQQQYALEGGISPQRRE